MARILVIDDETEWLQLVRDRLSGQGHEVLTADDCVEALDKLRAVPPDLIVLDLRMPVSGRTMLQALGEDWPEIPVVLHTVYRGYRDSPGFHQAAGFATKDPECAELVSVVQRILGGGHEEAGASHARTGREQP
jgi:CheY-like chemotaxis protein